MQLHIPKLNHKFYVPIFIQSPIDSLLGRSLLIMSVRSWTTSDICGLNSGSDCMVTLRLGKGNHPIIGRKQNLGLQLDGIHNLILYRVRGNRKETNNIILTWTHREMISAKFDKDLAEYSPLTAGSTIFDNVSMSWSWGIAHLTRKCSPRVRVLSKIWKEDIIK